MDRPWKVVLAFVGVFIAGAVFGGVFTARSARLADRPAKAGKQAGKEPSGRIYPQLMRQFTQRLNPTAEQQKAITPIVARAAEDLQRMQREHLADTTRTTERMYEDVAALLTPEQRLKLDKMHQEMRERVRREKEKRGEAAPGPDVAAKSAAKGGS
ncbi:MAG: hypothetical protein ACKPB0_08040 [Opitutaceae bacterium]